MIIIHNKEYYLDRDKKDIFMLSLTRNKLGIKYDEATLVEHKAWLDAADIKYTMTCWPGWMCGDSGLYYLYVDGWDDPRLLAYCAKFEDAEGKSLDPTKYNIYVEKYDEWVAKGGPVEYAQYLKDLEDPNYCD
jgi:hypothetical protein